AVARIAELAADAGVNLRRSDSERAEQGRRPGELPAAEVALLIAGREDKLGPHAERHVRTLPEIPVHREAHVAQASVRALIGVDMHQRDLAGELNLIGQRVDDLAGELELLL